MAKRRHCIVEQVYWNLVSEVCACGPEESENGSGKMQYCGVTRAGPWASCERGSSKCHGNYRSLKVLPEHEKERSGEFLVQKSVLLGSEDGVFTVEGARAAGWKDAEKKSRDCQIAIVLRGAAG